MPKIKPETKVLIIKNLKSKSPAEVADIFNVSKRQVEKICKCYQETGVVHDRPRASVAWRVSMENSAVRAWTGVPSALCRLLPAKETYVQFLLQRTG
ncbi:hypothetical protein AAFF_G00090400 [Aldrovandia affinis]|uniref:Uncharacterized protein n=1 Tax=Aldrovandia affinis TaxID=143900 RepID=A0AAD7WCD8_9TELE|nr:hypothetical protein AAFF_G00090400 [Aldrovandia affinis]